MRIRDLTWAELISIVAGIKILLSTFFSVNQILLAYFKAKPGWSAAALARFELAQKINSILSTNLPHPPGAKES